MHEMSTHVFWKKNKDTITNMSWTELSQRVVKVDPEPVLAKLGCLHSVKRNTGDLFFSKTIFHLLNDYCKAVSCDLQLNSKCFSYTGLDVGSNKLYQSLFIEYRIKYIIYKQ